MPYNNTPITPANEVTGSCALPLARIKKIIASDPDTGNCSSNASFAIAVATEQFVQYLVEQTHTVVKSERKPRRNIQYRDVAGAVSKYDNLEFLIDVVPHTVPFKEYKRKQKIAQGEAPPEGEAPPQQGPLDRQRTLNFGNTNTEVDAEMGNAEADRDPEVNGGAAVHAGSSATARHTFDAVRNSFDANAGQNISMEED